METTYIQDLFVFRHNFHKNVDGLGVLLISQCTGDHRVGSGWADLSAQPPSNSIYGWAHDQPMWPRYDNCPSWSWSSSSYSHTQCVTSSACFTIDLHCPPKQESSSEVKKSSVYACEEWVLPIWLVLLSKGTQDILSWNVVPNEQNCK